MKLKLKDPVQLLIGLTNIGIVIYSLFFYEGEVHSLLLAFVFLVGIIVSVASFINFDEVKKDE